MSGASNSAMVSWCLGEKQQDPGPLGRPREHPSAHRAGRSPARPYNAQHMEPLTATGREARENSCPAV